MIGKVIGQYQFGTEIFQEPLETIRAGNGAQSGNFGTFKCRQRQDFFGFQSDQMLRFVTAFDDLRPAGVTADEPFEVLIFVTAVRFGQKNVIRPPDIFDRFRCRMDHWNPPARY